MNRVFFDLETTGTDPDRHEIIQIAAIAVSDDYKELRDIELKLEFSLTDASPEALEVNSYNSKVWYEEAIPATDAARAFASFLRKHADVKQMSKKGRPFYVARLVAHNAAFDTAFLRNLYKKRNLFLPASYLVLDTLQLAMWQKEWPDGPPRNLKLSTLAGYFGVEVEGEAHDALTDVRMMIGVAKALECS